MKTQPIQVHEKPLPVAGVVLLWCVLAGGLVAGLLLVEPPEGGGLQYRNPTGALRLLTDLILFYCIFLVPAFRRGQTGSATDALEPTTVVLYTGVLGLVMLDHLVGLPGTLWHLIAFVVLVVAGACLWSLVLAGRRALYYSAAAILALGLPMIGFFCDELFRIEAGWLDVLSPFTAWRGVLARGGAAWGAWTVFGVALVSGVVAACVSRRRKSA